MPEVQTITVVRTMDMITVQGALSSANITSTGVLACGVRCSHDLCLHACMSRRIGTCHLINIAVLYIALGQFLLFLEAENRRVWFPGNLVLELAQECLTSDATTLCACMCTVHHFEQGATAG